MSVCNAKGMGFSLHFSTVMDYNSISISKLQTGDVILSEGLTNKISLLEFMCLLLLIFSQSPCLSLPIPAPPLFYSTGHTVCDPVQTPNLSQRNLREILLGLHRLLSYYPSLNAVQCLQIMVFLITPNINWWVLAGENTNPRLPPSTASTKLGLAHYFERPDSEICDRPLAVEKWALGDGPR